MPSETEALVDWAEFGKLRAQLGVELLRILGYFREDGIKSVRAIEEAMRHRNAAALVRPAHKLKGEARQFGALPLADLAEAIEFGARRCVEHHERPDELMASAARLRPLLEASIGLLDRETNPIVGRRRFGRKMPVAIG